MKPTYWAEYDLDGSFEFYVTEGEDPADYPASYAGNLLGPYATFAACKRDLSKALTDVIDQLKSTKAEVRRMKPPGGAR